MAIKQTNKTLKRIINHAKRVKTHKFKPEAYCEIFFVRHALTEQNKMGIGYDNYGKDEYYPITKEGRQHAFKSGKHFAKYGKFDYAYLSPRHRCQQTFEEINKSLKIPNDKVLITNNLLEGTKGIANLMTYEKFKKLGAKLRKDNKLFEELEKKYENETNEFKKLDYEDEYYALKDKLLKKTPKNTIKNNFKKFLKQLAKDIKQHGYKRVICVGHSGTVVGIQEIIQGGKACPHYEYIKPKNPKQFVEYGSTLYMAAKYIMKNNEYKIVIPYNNLQLLEKE